MNIIELMTLGFLHEGPLCGYQLCQRMRQLLGRTRAFSEGSVHAVTERLVNHDYIRATNQVVHGRNRRTFHLTPSGYDLLISTLRTANDYLVTDMAKWTVVLSFLSVLPNERDRLAVLRRRLNTLDTDARHMYCDDNGPVERTDIEDPYRRALLAIHDAQVDAERAWLHHELGDNEDQSSLASSASS